MAAKSDIIDAIEALAVHCRPPLMPVEQRELWMRDWCEDLEQYPIEVIRAACRQYRHSGATKFPTAGHLLPLVRQAMPREGEPEPVREWAPLGDQEYAALSLREKIRHQLILAAEASRKAGPMFKNTAQGSAMHRASGEHLTADRMPDAWRHWTQMAANHRAEAERLRGHLHAQPRIAAR